ncbi:hypothetical protein SAMN04490243_2243 [Robiginitalea myxolifaciens]|uniref:Outer membrane protein beta-barrel domain-containing protein n=1 Tax=Robiginitalea myxolifaciens TaxID=400055 RepID=A0A1I6H4B8_9FLAO|nr:hypothetical protein [Robiginitalea myxolifaciens]SFR49336.1 hypothetical protein SAMN04490243_2243 [Robiginitalea myxolifaciens]
MKKVIVVLAFLAGGLLVNAQDDTGATSEGRWLIEANTGFGGDGLAHGANTSFGLSTSDGSTIWAVGGEAGYFVIDDLAIKVGLGYTDLDGFSLFTYKLGAKYYINSAIPVQLDLTGGSIQDADENPLYLGMQGGYAIFISNSVSIEPGLRYNFSLNDQFTEEGIFEIRVGFVIHI